MNHNTITPDPKQEVPPELAGNNLEQSEKEDTLSEKLQDLSESLNPRIEKAIDASEFEGTAEIREAIKSYYNDHYKSALIIEEVINGEPVNPSVLANDDTEMESFDITESLEKIITEQDRHKQFEQVNDFILRKLFAEASVGQTTLSDQEYQLIINLGDQLHQQVAAENGYLRSPVTPEGIMEKREQATKLFWEDGRAAGQLEFHNTPFPDKLAQDGFKLRTKPNQSTEKGEYNSVTADVQGHSNTIHFSETFYTDSYKSVQAGKRTEGETIGATIAIPLAKIVEQTPYARRGEYGVVSLKLDKSADVTIHEDVNIFTKTNNHNAGGFVVEQGADGDDRTFYADKYDRTKGEDYALDFGSSTRSQFGNTAHILFLQRDIDIAHNNQFRKDGKNVDHRISYGAGETFPAVTVLDYDHKDRMDRVFADPSLKSGAMFIEEAFHKYDDRLRGHPFAQPDERLARTANEDKSYRDGMTFEDQAQELEAKISELQRQSREHPDFKGKFVVMLRAGTMAYMPRA